MHEQIDFQNVIEDLQTRSNLRVKTKQEKKTFEKIRSFLTFKVSCAEEKKSLAKMKDCDFPATINDRLSCEAHDGNEDG